MMGEGLQVSYRNFKLERINILRVYCLKEKILISQEFLCGLSEYQMNEGGMGADPQPLLHLCIPPAPPTSSIRTGFELLGLGWSAGRGGFTCSLRDLTLALALRSASSLGCTTM